MVSFTSSPICPSLRTQTLACRILQNAPGVSVAEIRKSNQDPGTGRLRQPQSGC
jgi:hypothetical protein